MADHASRSCSGAARWTMCPGSPRLEAAAPSQPSSRWAAEGTLAHEYLEDSLRLGVRAEELIDDPDMAVPVQVAANYVNRQRRRRGRKSQLYIERRVNPGGVIGRSDLWGTADVILVWDDSIEIADYKHGRGVVVDIVGNLQLRLYAIGAVAEFGDRSKLKGKAIRTTIIQPRAPHASGPVRSADYTLQELDEFTAWIAERAAATDAPDAPLVPGAWCHWCDARAAGICPIQREKALAKGREELAAIPFPAD